MKWILFTSAWFAIGMFATQIALADTVVINNKAYTLVEVDGELLVSNEWSPTTDSGYDDDYLQSEQYQMVKAANETLKRIKGGEL